MAANRIVHANTLLLIIIIFTGIIAMRLAPIMTSVVIIAAAVFAYGGVLLALAYLPVATKDRRTTLIGLFVISAMTIFLWFSLASSWNCISWILQHDHNSGGRH